MISRIILVFPRPSIHLGVSGNNNHSTRDVEYLVMHV